jgi:hypothetical protein
MRRGHFALVLAGALVLLVSLPATWWQITLVGGGSIPVSGLDLSALGATLLGVAGAGFGASLLLRGIPRRASMAISTVALGFSGWSYVAAAATPELAAVEMITMRTGVSGAAALELVESPTGSAWLVVALVGLTLAFTGSILGVLAPDSLKRQQRYERFPDVSDDSDGVATWDHLTSGVDPTKR